MSIKDLFKPIQLHSTDRLVRWAYLGVDKYNRPNVTSLCEVFWRSVLLTPLKLIGLLACYLGLCYSLGLVSYENPWILPSVAGILLSIVGVVVLISYLIETAKEKDLGYKVGNRFNSFILVRGFKAVKAQYCPIVYID